MDRLIGCQGGLLVTPNPCIPRSGEKAAEVVPSGSRLEVTVRPEHVDLFKGQRPYKAIILPELPTFLCHVTHSPDVKGTLAARRQPDTSHEWVDLCDPHGHHITDAYFPAWRCCLATLITAALAIVATLLPWRVDSVYERTVDTVYEQ
ncbi:hypothetical protein [Streptomyces sp. NPDC094022]|uniref:hypothetical protein n=1 Tax=Streptomyces sp. NPDC094022 TaxID=3155206 RepID=UPI003328BC13